MFGFGRNTIKQGDGFYISYNPATDCGAETALVKDGKFYILLGNHMHAYEALISKGFEACKEYFYDHKNSQSKWSN